MKARIAGRSDFSRRIFVLVAVLLAAFLVAAPLASAASTAAANDQYTPNPPGGGNGGGGNPHNCSNGTYFHNHKTKCIKQKCKKKSFFKHHKSKCHKYLAKRTVPGTTASSFIGYPATGLILVMIGLVGGAVAIRFGWAAWERRRNLSV